MGLILIRISRRLAYRWVDMGYQARGVPALLGEPLGSSEHFCCGWSGRPTIS